MRQTELCITPQTCTARRDPRCSYTATIGTMFHIQYRGIQTKVNKVPHTTIQELKALIGKEFHNQYRSIRTKANKVPHTTIQELKTFIDTAFHNQYRSIPTKVNKVPHTTIQELKALIGKAFHNQHRSIQTKVNTAAHPHNQALNKKARGVCRGAMALWPLCGFLASQSQKPSPPAKERKTYIKSAQRTTFNIEAYRNKSTPLNIPTTKHSTKKPEGCAEGPWLYGPFAVFQAFQSQKISTLPRKTKNNL